MKTSTKIGIGILTVSVIVFAISVTWSAVSIVMALEKDTELYMPAIIAAFASLIVAIVAFGYIIYQDEADKRNREILKKIGFEDSDFDEKGNIKHLS